MEFSPVFDQPIRESPERSLGECPPSLCPSALNFAPISTGTLPLFGLAAPAYTSMTMFVNYHYDAGVRFGDKFVTRQAM
jgi:hypothetical protein